MVVFPAPLTLTLNALARITIVIAGVLVKGNQRLNDATLSASPTHDHAGVVPLLSWNGAENVSEPSAARFRS